MLKGKLTGGRAGDVGSALLWGGREGKERPLRLCGVWASGSKRTAAAQEMASKASQVGRWKRQWSHGGEIGG